MGREQPFILFRDDRPKNVQALLDLKLRRPDRLAYVAALCADQASHCLLPDDAMAQAAGRWLWVFGILVGKPGKKQRPAYVKIQLGITNAAPVCISFHPPDHRLDFLFPSPHSTAFHHAYDAQS